MGGSSAHGPGADPDPPPSAAARLDTAKRSERRHSSDNAPRAPILFVWELRATPTNVVSRFARKKKNKEKQAQAEGAKGGVGGVGLSPVEPVCLSAFIRSSICHLLPPENDEDVQKKEMKKK